MEIPRRGSPKNKYYGKFSKSTFGFLIFSSISDPATLVITKFSMAHCLKLSFVRLFSTCENLRLQPVLD